MSIRPQALPALLELWAQLVDLCAQQGIAIDVADFGGFRTAADTAAILNYKQADYAAYAAAELRAGRSPVPIDGPWENGSNRPIAPYGQSYHDYGAARDVAIVAKPASMSGLAAVATVDNLAESLGLETGANYGDPLHVQLPIALEEARGEWQAYVDAGGDAGDSSSSSAGRLSTAAAVIVFAAAIGAVAVASRYARGIQTWR